MYIYIFIYLYTYIYVMEVQQVSDTEHLALYLIRFYEFEEDTKPFLS
jgi:hypothetical protein